MAYSYRSWPSDDGDRVGGSSSTRQKRPDLGFESPAIELVSDATHRPQEVEASTEEDFVGRFWLWEIAASIFSIACLAAIVGVLIYEDGKRLDQWQLMLSPNAIISFLAAIAKSSLLLVVTEVLSQLKWLHFTERPRRLRDFKHFDNASRGPQGALQLLLSTKVNLAWIGAIITLVALLVDPFVQLVLDFPSHLAIDPNVHASFSRTFRYHEPQLKDHVGISRADAVSSGMQSAIIRGLDNSTIQPSTSCPSGNCDWSDPVDTLGICSSCEDITTHLQKSCHVIGRYSESYVCSYGLPSGYTLTASLHHPPFLFTKWGTQWNSTSTLGEHVSFISTPAIISEFEAIQIPELSNRKQLMEPRGWRCKLNLCLKTFSNMTVRNGMTSIAPPDETHLWWHVGGADPYLTIYPGLPADRGRVYNIDADSFLDLRAYLGQMFSLGWSSDNTNSYPTNSTVDFDDDLGHNTLPAAAVPPGRTLATVADLGHTMKALSNSMTEAIRAFGDKEDAAKGTVLVPATFINVRWPWLILPMALPLLSTALLIMVAWQTRRKGVPTWKSDPLAMLWHDFARDSRPSPVPNVAGPKDLEVRANQVWVQLGSSRERVFVAEEKPRRDGGMFSDSQSLIVRQT